MLSHSGIRGSSCFVLNHVVSLSIHGFRMMRSHTWQPFAFSSCRCCTFGHGACCPCSLWASKPQEALGVFFACYMLPFCSPRVSHFHVHLGISMFFSMLTLIKRASLHGEVQGTATDLEDLRELYLAYVVRAGCVTTSPWLGKRPGIEIMGFHVMLLVCHAISCNVMRCHAMSCHAMSCHAMSCHFMPCHAMSCHAMWYHVRSCHVRSCHAMSGHAMPCQVMPCEFHEMVESCWEMLRVRSIWGALEVMCWFDVLKLLTCLFKLPSPCHHKHATEGPRPPLARLLGAMSAKSATSCPCHAPQESFHSTSPHVHIPVLSMCLSLPHQPQLEVLHVPGEARTVLSSKGWVIGLHGNILSIKWPPWSILVRLGIEQQCWFTRGFLKQNGNPRFCSRINEVAWYVTIGSCQLPSAFASESIKASQFSLLICELADARRHQDPKKACQQAWHVGTCVILFATPTHDRWCWWLLVVALHVSMMDVFMMAWHVGLKSSVNRFDPSSFITCLHDLAC